MDSLEAADKGAEDAGRLGGLVTYVTPGSLLIFPFGGGRDRGSFPYVDDEGAEIELRSKTRCRYCWMLCRSTDLAGHAWDKCPLASLKPKWGRCNPVVANAIIASLVRLDPTVSEQARVLGLCADAWGVQRVPPEMLSAPDGEGLVELTNAADVFQHIDTKGMVRFTTTDGPGATATSIRQIVAFLLGAVGGVLVPVGDEAVQRELHTPNDTAKASAHDAITSRRAPREEEKDKGGERPTPRTWGPAHTR
jgi:hypothetical protein